jgi:condensin-2 complex subunit H2
MGITTRTSKGTKVQCTISSVFVVVASTHILALVSGKPEKAPSFEELCREHIRRFAKGAERYAVQTKLSERVDQWQNKLRPLLDAEEQRPVFDIHQYGQAVIHDIQESVAATNEKAVNFAEVTKHCSRYEVCRRFLASLSLVNSGNIRLVDNNDLSPDVVRFELVSSTIERPMETFLAPSVREHGADDDGADGDDVDME